MPGLVLELQKNAIDPSIPLTDLLLNAWIVAKKLNVIDFERWILCELYGYKDESIVPKYREVEGKIKFFVGFDGVQSLRTLDTTNISGFESQKHFQSAKITLPIRELEKILGDPWHIDLHIELPEEFREFLMHECRECSYFTPYLAIEPSLISCIIDGARRNVLDWSLRLEMEGICGEGLTVTKEETETAYQKIINIHNFQGVLGDVSNSSIIQDIVISTPTNDILNLAEFLKTKRVSAEDISELEEAIKTDLKPKSSKVFGSKVSKWIGKMIVKAASGTWDIDPKVAETTLTKVISLYYGLHY